MGPAADLARRLAQNAEAVCREYLSNGRREGDTWRVGDIDNTPGRSLVVRLTGPESGKGAAGRWVDFASGQHGDLLDLIAHTCRLHTFRDVLDEARRFLSMPEREYQGSGPARPPVPSGSPEAAQRLFASAKPIPGTLAAIYLRSRGIADVHDLPALRFHPRCFYRAHEGVPPETWPALLAAVTDLDGAITGVLRTWLARDGSGKAPLATPRRSLGHLLGSGVRESLADDSPLGSPQGAMQVILQGISDRFGARPDQRFNSYEVIGRRLVAELYNGIVDALRLYRPRPVAEEQLAAGKGGDDALRAVREAGGYLVLAPELQDGPDAIAALLAFLGDESGKSRRRVDVLAAVVRVMRSFVSHGWHNGAGQQNVQISSWSHLAKAVAADIKKQRSKAAC